MSLLRLRFSVRGKILGLLAGSLIASLLCFIYVGTDLIREDKLSYIYDFNLGRVRAFSNEIDSQIQGALLSARSIGRFSRSFSDESSLKQLFEISSRAHGIRTLMILRPEAGKTFQTELVLGEDSPATRQALMRTGWTPERFVKDPAVVGGLSDGLLPVAAGTIDEQGRPVVVFALLDQKSRRFEAIANFEVRLVDSRGNTLALNRDPGNALDSREAAALEHRLLQGEFDSGARDWIAGGREYIVAYQRVGLGNLVVTGFVPKAAALVPVDNLVQRSTSLGVSVLCLALGLALLLARGLATRISQLWHHTVRVGQGDFSGMIALGRAPRDELSDLATSFNGMTSRIKDLISEVAEKARIEQEVQTAALVQSRFFPPRSFDHPRFRLAGSFLSASECAGDWWQYAQVGDHLVIVVGDVMGHGASAAMVTAAAYGSFASCIGEFQKMAAPAPDLRLLMKRLNDAVFASGGGESPMTCFCAAVELGTGMMEMINASHCAPYRYQRGREFEPLMIGKDPPLGYRREVEFSVEDLRLTPGELVIWYTDGLLSCRNEAKEKFRKLEMMELLSELHGLDPSAAHPICEGLMTRFQEFLGTEAGRLQDDVTVIVGVMPEVASREDPSRAA